MRQLSASTERPESRHKVRPPGRTLASQKGVPNLTHGATSERRIRPIAARHRRRLRRQFGLRDRDLGPLERGYLNLLARLLAKIELADAYIDEHGLILADGKPQPVMAMYVSLVNSARLTLARLEDSLRATPRPGTELADYLEVTYSEDADRD